MYISTERIMEQDKLNINLRIGEKTYPMKISREDEEKFRNASRFAQEKYIKYKETYDNLPVEDLMAMTILDLAKNNIDISEKKGNSTFFLELSDIVDSLGEYLKGQ